MKNSHIEWTNHTFNPWWGCMKVSEGCKNCYAETLDNRYNHENPHWGPNSPRKAMSDAYWKNPLKWDKDAAAAGIKAKVFCASMADVFEDHQDVIEWRKRLFDVIDGTPSLIWQLLTKRPENILKFIPERWNIDGWPQNIWMGTSVENQKAADDRIPYLIQVPAKIRFLSCEPLLGEVDLGNVDFPIPNKLSFLNVLMGTGFSENSGGFKFDNKIDWVICGGESGHNARPLHPDWARTLRDQCATSKVPFFFKQWGEYWPAGKAVVENKEMLLFGNEAIYKVGKHAAGAVLDGKEYKEFPND